MPFPVYSIGSTNCVWQNDWKIINQIYMYVWDQERCTRLCNLIENTLFQNLNAKPSEHLVNYCITKQLWWCWVILLVLYYSLFLPSKSFAWIRINSIPLQELQTCLGALNSAAKFMKFLASFKFLFLLPKCILQVKYLLYCS